MVPACRGKVVILKLKEKAWNASFQQSSWGKSKKVVVFAMKIDGKSVLL